MNNVVPITLSRKQREIKQRDQLILDAACEIMRESGYMALSMERIAQKIEYAKGTVYQHYKNKEEILAAIVKRNLQDMVDLFDRAVVYEGRTRERLVAVMLAYKLYIQLHPEEFGDFQVLKNVAIREKLSPEKLAEIHDLESHGINVSAAIIHEAVKLGEINLREVTPEELVFGSWALAFGSASLMFSEIPLDKLGVSDPMKITLTHARHLLDGYNWQPLSDDWDYEKTTQDVLSTIFAEEVKQLTLTGVNP